MEFRVIYVQGEAAAKSVDIGTEWNLELQARRTLIHTQRVDIGTEWNLESNISW